MYHSKGWMKASLVLLVSLLFLWACSEASDYQRIEGPTMGTEYHITVDVPNSTTLQHLEAEISQRLKVINQSMSTYIPESEISRFNDSAPGEWLAVSDDFLQVLTLSQTIYMQSKGAFNPTIGPLVDLWGFGPILSVQSLQKIPDAKLIAARLEQLDFSALELVDDKLRKHKPMRLDFSAVAKGYAVDAIASVLQKNGVSNAMVEIGGEVKTFGKSPRGTAWLIGIAQPQQLQGKTFKALSLENAAVATSGDYRNYLEIDGRRYSHSIDPTTGYPVDHHLASVTVITDTVAAADAWATAIMVLGQDKGFALAQQQKLAIYMIYRDEGKYSVKYTSSMQDYLVD